MGILELPTLLDPPNWHSDQRSVQRQKSISFFSSVLVCSLAVFSVTHRRKEILIATNTTLFELKTSDRKKILIIPSRKVTEVNLINLGDQSNNSLFTENGTNIEHRIKSA